LSALALVLVLVPILVLAGPPAIGEEARRGLPSDPGGLPSSPGRLPGGARGLDPAVRRAGADEAWLQTVTARLAREEYDATSSPEGIQAPNRAHNLRTSFRERGRIEVAPRAGAEPSDAAGAGSWGFVWTTTRVGRLGALRSAAGDAAGPETDGSRVTYRRPGFDEWYENSSKGIEQGFTLHASPAGEGPLCLVGRIEGSLHAELREQGAAVVLLDEQGNSVLRYGELHVWDSAGAEIPSRLGLEASDLVIIVEDAEASYPLTIDPLMTSPAWTEGGDQDAARFGCSVATAGDVNGDGFSDVIVGAKGYDNGHLSEGSAFVYHGSASGLGTTAAWSAESNQADARFGNSVATAGDVNGDGFSDVIIGAEYYSNPETDEGRVFVYHGSADGLAPTPAWTAESDQQSAFFGASVSTAGDVNGDGFSDVVVGAPLYDHGQFAEGRAYVYHGSVTGLAEAPAWTAENNQAEAEFGASVAMAGDVNGDGFSDLIVGAARYDNGQSNEGRAYVYHGSAGGLGVAPAWTAENDQAEAEFGTSVATAGDVNGDGYSDVIVASPLFDFFQTDEGRAYVYHGSVTGLALTAAWTVESNQDLAYFGASVATAGDVNGDGYSDVIVGAIGSDGNRGRAFAYQGSAAGLATTAAWTASADQTGGRFGVSVATAGDVNGDGLSDVIVGADGIDFVGENDGWAFAYHGSTAGLATAAGWTAESNQADAEFGVSVGTAGDVNGDGYSDVIVGAHRYDQGQVDEGRVFVYHGSAPGLSTAPAWSAEGDQAGALFGSTVGTAGDVNGDGYSDVIVGARQFDNGQNDEGRAFVYHGSISGLAAGAAWTTESNQDGANLGSSVASAGDVNGDGYSDVIVGAHAYDNGQSDEGRAFVYHGSVTGLATAPAWTAESNQANAFFGISVATAGDVNGDGFSDAVIGAYQYDNGQSNEGGAFVYHGSIAGLSTAPAWTAESNQASALFGEVASAGDVNGDGFSDVIVGAFLYSNGETGEGRAFVYHGSVTGLAAGAAWTAEANQISARFGASVATAGDVNGDGFSDIVVGAPFYDNGEDDEGRAFAYCGSMAGLATAPAWTAESNQVEASLGISVATAGDVNGDGYSDVVVGARAFDSVESNEGRAFVHYGNGGTGGRRRVPRQQRTDGVTDIALLGRSDSETQFRIRCDMLSFYGRTRVQMEQEVKPRGVSFDGLNLVPGNFFDTGSDGVISFNRLVSGLTPDTKYHWRVRAKYDLVKTPFQHNGPWVHIPLNGWNETDLSTGGTTSAAPRDGGAVAASGTGFDLFAASANPASGGCEVGLALGRRAHIRAEVVDVAGRRVAVLVDDALYDRGAYVLKWDGRDGHGSRAAAGVYFICVRSGDATRVRKAVLTR